MTLIEDIQADLIANHYSSDSFSHTTMTYAGVEILAQVKYGEDKDEVSGALYATAEMMVLKSDVAAPTYRDTVVIEGNSWKIRNVIKGNQFAWLLKLYMDERPVW